MLGERKTRGVFNEGKNSEWGSRMQELMPTQAAPVEPVAREPVEVVSKSADDLFFAAVEGKDFATVLQEVQEHIASRYSSLLTDGNNDDVKRQMKRYITKYVQENRVAVQGMSNQELVDNLYTEMAEFSFLTKYIFGEGVEEIDINSWKDIEIQYSGGGTEKLEEHFDSPSHAINVIRRMLHVSGTILDDASPVVTGTLAKNIRIAVLKTPVAGATSSGKTTVAGWLLTTIPDRKRIFTIENGSRELDLIREESGKVLNSVVHTLTRDSENDRQRIDQIALLDIALRFNPDILVVGEMRGAEANAAQEAARTGVAVVTTIHSNSCEATYRRMVSLCKRAVDMSDETLMGYVTEAYPIIVFCKQLENRQRVIMEIMECEIKPDGTRRYRPLYQYEIMENQLEGDYFVVNGKHRVMNSISDGLYKRLLENGMPMETLNRFRSKGEGGEES